MPRPHLLIGSTLRSIRHELLQRGANHNQPLVLIPGFDAQRGWHKVAQKYFSDGCALPHFAVTDGWFIEAALASAESSLRFITPTQRRLVLRSLLASLKSQSQLTKLNDLVDSNQFLQQIDQWMAHLFEANVQSWPENGGPWSRDLQTILQNYDSWKQRQSGQVRDTEFAPLIFADNIHNYPALPRQIVLDGAVTLSHNQRAGMKSLAANCDTFRVNLAVPGIGSHCETWMELLEFVKGSLIEDVLKFWFEQDAEVEILESENAIYTDRLIDLKGLTDSRNDVYKTSISSAHTLRHELRGIATSIRENSPVIHDAAKSVVLLNNTSRYSDLLKSTFTEYGLPLRRSPGQSLLASPLVQKWMQLLNLPNHHWKVSALADVFAGGALAFVVEDHVLDVRRIEKASAVLRQYSLNDLSELSGLLDKSTFTREMEVDDTKKDIEVLAALQQRLAEINSADSHQDWLQLVTSLWMDATAHWKEEKSEIAKIAQLQINDVQSALQKLQQSTSSWQKYFQENSEVWQSQLNLALSEAKSSGGVGIRSGVDAASPRQLIQDVPEVIYWPGMLEADYPGASKGALQSRHQKAISDLCPHLPTPTSESIYWMALALAEAGEIHFSWPSYCDDRFMLASVLLEEIRLTEIAESEYVGSENGYFSNSQLRRDIGILAHKNAEILTPLESPFPEALWKMYGARNGLDLNSFDGSLGSGEQLMDAAFLKDRKPLFHSATSLKTYAQCGLKYFFQKVLLLEERPELSFLLEQLDFGNVIHAVLEKLYMRFHHPLNAQNKKAAWDLLMQLSRDEVATLPLPAVLQEVELSRLIGSGDDEPQGMLGRYLMGEINLRESGWAESTFAQPMQPFGLSGLSLPDGLERSYEAQFKLKLGEIALKGTFDRLDVSDAGNAILAVDYKTGQKLPVGKHAPDGIEFQLPLYLWALQQLFAEQEVQVAGVFFSLVNFEYRSGISPYDVLQKFPQRRASNADPQLMDGARWDEFMTIFSGQVQEIDRLINRGQFPISVRPEKEAGCTFCDYKNICFRNEELQMERRPLLREENDIYTAGLAPEKKTKEADTDD